MSTFIQEFAKTLLNRYNNDLSNIVVMFPSLRARVFFNDAISTIVDHPIWQPSWSTIDEIMERGSGIRRGERIRLISELYKIYVKHHPNESQCFSYQRYLILGYHRIHSIEEVPRIFRRFFQLLRLSFSPFQNHYP